MFSGLGIILASNVVAINYWFDLSRASYAASNFNNKISMWKKILLKQRTQNTLPQTFFPWKVSTINFSQTVYGS